ncbi:MAG: hypothetical protein AB7E10_02650 [Burkholderiaceae bacterium]
MFLRKTEKARLELSPGVRTLSLRERSLLLLAEGKRAAELHALHNGMGAQLLDKLIAEGYLIVEQIAEAVEAQLQPAPAVAQPTSKLASSAQALRSLPAARMYLFDMCERMFARRDPALADTFREALRNARDVESMLHVGAALIEEVVQMAGHERAQTIRERLKELLPEEHADPLGA